MITASFPEITEENNNEAGHKFKEEYDSLFYLTHQPVVPKSINSFFIESSPLEQLEVKVLKCFKAFSIEIDTLASIVAKATLSFEQSLVST